MKQINLTDSDRVCIVDDEDYEKVTRWSWRYLPQPTDDYRPGYAVATTENKVTAYMHRFILGVTFNPRQNPTDHINGDTLDNRKENLRVCTPSQNRANSNPHSKYKGKPTASKYKGVERTPYSWRARITVNQQKIGLGCYPTEEEAAEAYNQGALEYFGEYAKLNEIQ